MKVWKVCAGITAILLLLAGIGICFPHHDVTFERLQEAKSRLASLGFHCTSDCANGQLSCGFLLSRQTTTWSDVCELRKTGAMGPEWRGRVWVTLNPAYWQLESIPDQAGVRVWGAVVAFGDDELLREIEAAF